MGLIAEYNAVLGENPKELNYYLNGISRKSMLQVGAYFLGFKGSKSEYHDYRILVKRFFSPGNKDFAERLLDRIKQLESSENTIIIINPQSSLKLFQFAFENLTENETQTNDEIERNIFLAYLALNQLNTAIEKVAYTSATSAPPHLKVAALFFAQSYPYSDIINYNEVELFTSQFIKAVSLFEYLESNQRTQTLLERFISYYQCQSWESYLKRLLPILIAIIDKEREAHLDLTVRNDERFNENCDFIDKLIVEDTEGIEDYDFKKLRDKPIYKVEPGLYRIIYGPFMIEKLFKGLYFKLSELNKELSAPHKIGDLHSLYSDEFSEKTLLYNTLNSIYQNRYIKFTGQHFKDAGIDAEPDYYIRNGNYIFLFESKDFLIRADIKTSYDYNLMIDAFGKKLFSDPSPKAVLQLVRNIRRVLEKGFAIDTSYNVESVYIYPIIVVHDRQYNVVGLNKIVNDWFLREIKALEDLGFNTDRVQSILIIDIDTFVFHQDLFREKSLKLDVVIDDYYKHITLNKKKKYRDQEHANEYIKRTLIPFSSFITEYVFSKKMQRIPKLLKEKGYSLFE